MGLVQIGPLHHETLLRWKFPPGHSGMHPNPIPLQPPAMSPPLLSLDDCSCRTYSFDPMRLHDAMKGVIQWT
eukprot:4496928-Ditylum_brightwellii.AAC.2